MRNRFQKSTLLPGMSTLAEQAIDGVTPTKLVGHGDGGDSKRCSDSTDI